MDPFEHHHSRGLRHMDSHETFVSMMHIDPAPMEYEGEYEGGGEGENGTYYNNNNGTAAGDVAYNGGHDAENGNGASFSQRSRDLSFTAYSEKGSLGGVGSIGISSSGHGSVYYLARIQKYSSYAFTIFTTIHFANTAVIPLLVRSVPASETYLGPGPRRTARPADEARRRGCRGRSRRRASPLGPQRVARPQLDLGQRVLVPRLRVGPRRDEPHPARAL
jgi:hypothetical protein